MKRTAYLSLVIGFLLLFVAFAGCIEGSFTKTETVLVKLDSHENIQWISVIQNPDYATATALAPRFYRFIQTTDNGFFVAGYYSNRSGTTTLRVFRTDSNGNPVWDQRLARMDFMGVPTISPIQWGDGGYSVILNGGMVYNFDSAGKSLGVTNIQDPICRTNGTVCYDLTPFSLTQNPDGSLNWILTNGNFSTSQTTLITATVARNGTLLKKEILPLKTPNGVTNIIRTCDNGFLFGKEYIDYSPGGAGYEILIEKTNASLDILWDTVLGTCNTKTSFCNNDLIGMHDSGDGYDIIYQSHPQHSNESVPADTISARLDSQGRIVRQDTIPDLSGIPAWIFTETGSRPDFIDLIPRNVLDSVANAHGGNNPTFGSISLIRTADGGFALLGTRYYWS
ncbi:MAG: hypothetical protein WC362_01605 [Methanoregula sp.]|jgi:hypothetical protein